MGALEKGGLYCFDVRKSSHQRGEPEASTTGKPFCFSKKNLRKKKFCTLKREGDEGKIEYLEERKSSSNCWSERKTRWETFLLPRKPNLPELQGMILGRGEKKAPTCLTWRAFSKNIVEHHRIEK